MQAWALRAKATGLYLPWGKHNRNNSWEEFTSVDRPRLFNTKRSAVNTLIAWRYGGWHWRGYGEDTCLEPVRTKTVRNIEIEIVSFEMSETSTYRGKL